MKKALLASTLLTSALISGNAVSAVITQLAAPGALTLSNNFETSKNNADVTFNSTATIMTAAQATSNVTPSGDKGLVDSVGNAPLIGTLSSATTSVGMWFGNDDFNLDFNAVLEIFDGSTLLGSVSVLSNANDYADQFIGLSSDIAFDSFHIYYQRPNAQQLSVYIDDVYLASTSVPEPATLTLLGLGLAGIGFSRKKKTA